MEQLKEKYSSIASEIKEIEQVIFSKKREQAHIIEEMKLLQKQELKDQSEPRIK